MSTPAAPSAPVTDEEIQSYQRDGFVRLEEFFSGGEMDVLREAIDDAIASHRDRILGAEKGAGARMTTSASSTSWSTSGSTVPP